MRCPNCQQEQDSQSGSCQSCGHELLRPTLTDRGPTAGYPAPDRLPGGEHKQATVLFSDISGFTAMSARLYPEEIKEIMGGIFEEKQRKKC